MINLRRGLVVPGAPGLRAVNRNDGALIAGEHHAISIFRIDPKLVIVVAARRAFYGNPCLARIERHVGRRVDVIRAIGIGWVDDDLAEVPAASPQALFVVDQLPRRACVVGEINSAGGFRFRCFSAAGTASKGPCNRGAEIIDDCVKPVWIAGCNGDADLAYEIVRGSPPLS